MFTAVFAFSFMSFFLTRVVYYHCKMLVSPVLKVSSCFITANHFFKIFVIEIQVFLLFFRITDSCLFRITIPPQRTDLLVQLKHTSIINSRVEFYYNGSTNYLFEEVTWRLFPTHCSVYKTRNRYFN